MIQTKIKKSSWSIGLLILVFSCIAHAQTELRTYVEQCKSELNFQAWQVPTEINCLDGYMFARQGRIAGINDFVVAYKINENVDMVSACRWRSDLVEDGTVAAFLSHELIIHSRETGGTCFFAAKDVGTDDPRRPIPSTIPSPVHFPTANNFWLQPQELNDKELPSGVGTKPDGTHDQLICVDCHSQGPYIASRDIADELAQYGLINDGHDINVLFEEDWHYYAVGSNPPGDTTSGTHAFKAWNTIMTDNLYYPDFDDPGTFDCSTGCHQVAWNSDIPNLFPPEDLLLPKDRVLPSITTDINEFFSFGGMPPSGDESDYRWMNLETPWDGIEWETFALAKNPDRMLATPKILESCDYPGTMEAHAVGLPGEFAFSTDMMEWVPERLNTFNLKEGLLCLDSEQGPGKSCRNYETSYLCKGVNKFNDPHNKNPDYWTPWFDGDSPADGVDNELRSLDEVRLVCDKPIAIKTRFYIDVTPFEIHGPSDRLARISPYGVVCNNDDQVDGQCNNYVVRYQDCVGTTEEESVTMTNAWSNTRLTAGSSNNNEPARGQPYNSSWNTQHWVIEPETNTDYVRVRNWGTRTYLNVSGLQDDDIVETYEIRDWDSQRWIVESASPYYGYRLKNVYSGRYLTMKNTSSYSTVHSQNLNMGWTSQVWRFAVD